MNKYKWDIKKLIDAKKKLNVNDFKSIEEFEEVSDLYDILISTYIKDTFEEYIEYDDFNQLEYYENYIKSKPKWKFSGGYIEEGKTGVRVDVRPSFKKMIHDAKHNKFDLIIYLCYNTEQ